jgi:hypothetical protein
MKKLLFVTQKELAQILFNTSIIKGMPMFASLLQATEPKLTVKSRTNKDIKNNFGRVIKLSKVSVLLNTDYVVAVTNQLVREGKDVNEYQKGENTMPLTFGENNQFIGLFKGEFVLQYRPNDNIKPTTKFVADGKLINKEKLIDFLPKETEATNQGTDREILWRKLYLKGVRKMTINGQTYKVID